MSRLRDLSLSHLVLGEEFVSSSGSPLSSFNLVDEYIPDGFPGSGSFTSWASVLGTLPNITVQSGTPTYGAGPGSYNGVVVTGSVLQASTFTTQNPPFCVFMVLQFDNSASDPQFFRRIDNSPPRLQWRDNNGGEFRVLNNVTDILAIGSLNSVEGYNSGDWMVVGARFEEISQTMRIRVNDLSSTLATTVAGDSLADFEIGFFTGNVAHVAVCGDLSDANFALAIEALGSRYGITVT